MTDSFRISSHFCHISLRYPSLSGRDWWTGLVGFLPEPCPPTRSARTQLYATTYTGKSACVTYTERQPLCGDSYTKRFIGRWSAGICVQQAKYRATPVRLPSRGPITACGRQFSVRFNGACAFAWLCQSTSCPSSLPGKQAEGNHRQALETHTHF